MWALMKLITITMSLTDRFMHISLSREKFLKCNPPCSKCLVNSMCISDYSNVVGIHFIMINHCQLLEKFICNDKHFIYV